MDQPKLKLYAMAAAYNDAQGGGAVLSGTWLAYNDQSACGEFVAPYYLEGGPPPLQGGAALEIPREQVARVLDILDKGESRRGEVLRLVPREPEEAVPSDNLRPVSTRFRCRNAGMFGGTQIPTCSGVASAFCPYGPAVVEEASLD